MQSELLAHMAISAGTVQAALPLDDEAALDDDDTALDDDDTAFDDDAAAPPAPPPPALEVEDPGDPPAPVEVDEDAPPPAGAPVLAPPPAAPRLTVVPWAQLATTIPVSATDASKVAVRMMPAIIPGFLRFAYRERPSPASLERQAEVCAGRLALRPQ